MKRTWVVSAFILIIVALVGCSDTDARFDLTNDDTMSKSMDVMYESMNKEEIFEILQSFEIISEYYGLALKETRSRYHGDLRFKENVHGATSTEVVAIAQDLKTNPRFDGRIAPYVLDQTLNAMRDPLSLEEQTAFDQTTILELNRQKEGRLLALIMRKAWSGIVNDPIQVMEMNVAVINIWMQMEKRLIKEGMNQRQVAQNIFTYLHGRTATEMIHVAPLHFGPRAKK